MEDESADGPASALSALRAAVSGALARLLCRHLEGEPAWSRWAWVDDVEIESASVTSTKGLEIWGLAIWDDGARAQWVEPFLATLRVAGESQGLAEYRLRFGDTAVGLARKSPRSRQRHLVRDGPPATWLFTFDSPAA